MAGKLICLVTGAGSGFGALTVRALAKRGHTVFAGMRSLSPSNALAMEHLDSLKAFCAENKVHIEAVEQDVVSTESVNTSVRQVLARTGGRLDVVVHNAGHMVYGPAEAFTPEQLAEMYDVNTLGTQRLNRAVLPLMRKQKKGCLVWVGSSSTWGAVPPFLGPYFAAKAGLDGMATTYQVELSQFGIESTIILPGAFTKGTEHFKTAGLPADQDVLAAYRAPDSPYYGIEDKALNGLAGLEPPDADASVVAEKIADVIEMPHGARPRRVYHDPADDGSETVSAVREQILKYRTEKIGIGELLHVLKQS
ncbi:hypothetical protein VTK73DRAFT_4988 [Phialemonium thermophilum]|uniref:NADP-dependent 3-hydroxy acid dehydrogenase YdfG n=1 Tax=Phialemonium thermophilum TaxID=223376 RepID=A0ABR3XXT0_9PEZI